MFTKVTAAAVVAFAASSAYGHMLLAQPVPFTPSLGPSYVQAPLLPDGSNFPCKLPLYNAPSTMNTIPIGQIQPLKFYGTAVHGGGSCQLSVTYDDPPTPQSVFKVIHSIEGGCPARDTPGNLPDPSDGESVLTFPDKFNYTYTMPAIPAGKAVFAWTWFNTVGNREMYMNCAPITITGTGSADLYNSLPDIFKANIGAVGDGCATTEGTDILFPDPGDSIEFGNNKGPPFSLGSAVNCPSTYVSRTPVPDPTSAPGNPPSPTNSSSTDTTTSTDTTSSSSSSASSSSSLPADPTIPGGVFATGPTSPDTPAAAGPPVSPAAATPTTMITVVVPDSSSYFSTEPPSASATDPPSAPPADPAPSSPPASPDSPSVPSDSDVFTGACPTDGVFNCVNGTHFQQCAAGHWSVAMAVSDGTKCRQTDAKVANMDIVYAD